MACRIIDLNLWIFIYEIIFEAVCLVDDMLTTTEGRMRCKVDSACSALCNFCCQNSNCNSGNSNL
jgi:hypothetical protein